MYAFYWLGLSILLFVIEAVTINLITIWFGIGSLVATLVSLVTDSIAIQVTVFLGVSAITLALTRPLLVRKLKKTPTNADSLIGKVAIVTREIDNINATGEVKVEGKYWSARSSNGVNISENENVTVEKIEGVKLIVSLSEK